MAGYGVEMGSLLSRFWHDEAGATAIEYGLLAALIAVALIASFTILGNTIVNLFGAGGAGNVIAGAAGSL